MKWSGVTGGGGGRSRGGESSDKRETSLTGGGLIKSALGERGEQRGSGQKDLEETEDIQFDSHSLETDGEQ